MFYSVMYFYEWLHCYIFLFSPGKTKSIASVRPFLTDCNSCQQSWCSHPNCWNGDDLTPFFCCGEGFSYTGSLGGFRIALGHYVAKAFLQNYTRNQSKSLMAKWHQHSVFGLYGTTLATYFSITFSITIWSICPNCINIPLFHYKINHWKSLPPSLVQDILVSESSAGPNLHQSSAMLPTASKERSGGTRKATGLT